MFYFQGFLVHECKDVTKSLKNDTTVKKLDPNVVASEFPTARLSGSPYRNLGLINPKLEESSIRNKREVPGNGNTRILSNNFPILDGNTRIDSKNFSILEGNTRIYSNNFPILDRRKSSKRMYIFENNKLSNKWFSDYLISGKNNVNIEYFVSEANLTLDSYFKHRNKRSTFIEKPSSKSFPNYQPVSGNQYSLNLNPNQLPDVHSNPQPLSNSQPLHNSRPLSNPQPFSNSQPLTKPSPLSADVRNTQKLPQTSNHPNLNTQKLHCRKPQYVVYTWVLCMVILGVFLKLKYVVKLVIVLVMVVSHILLLVSVSDVSQFIE